MQQYSHGYNNIGTYDYASSCPCIPLPSLKGSVADLLKVQETSSYRLYAVEPDDAQQIRRWKANQLRAASQTTLHGTKQCIT